jgi:NTE family protein
MKHLLATIGYPQYGFPWIDVDDRVYAWDGALLSNTPIREVMAASPSKDKNIFVVENYPKKIGKLPSNMSEVPCSIHVKVFPVIYSLI